MYTILIILGIILFTIGGIGWIRSADEGNNSKFIAVALIGIFVIVIAMVFNAVPYIYTR